MSASLSRWLVAPLVASVAMGFSGQVGNSPTFVAGACPRDFRIPAGVDSSWVQCGSVTVPQDRQQPSAKLAPVVLPVTVYRAPSANNPVPIVFLAGGPGEPAIDVAAELFMATPTGQLLARERPIIAFNQRGFGSSSSGTSPDLGVLSYRWRATRDESIGTLVDSAKKISGRLRSRGVLLRNFTTLQAADDIRDVVQALGYKRVILFGTSYGTRVALQVMRRHPDFVEAAILDGVAPPQHTDVFDSDRLDERRRAVAARVVDDCLKAPACRAEYGDLKSAATAMDRADAPPLHVVVNLQNDGGWVALDVRGRDVLSAIGAYASMELARASLPQLMEELARGDTVRRAMTPQIVLHVVHTTALASTAGPAYPVVYHAVLCGDIPAGVMQAGGRPVCDALGVPFSGPEATTPVRSDVPTLMLSSTYDAQTPPELAAEAASTLRRSFRVLFPGVGHLAYARPITASCVAVIVHGFLLAPTQQPPDACATSLVPAFLPRSTDGPR
jgi:pimeloyl-ACP methyl ester carboxylesterase